MEEVCPNGGDDPPELHVSLSDLDWTDAEWEAEHERLETRWMADDLARTKGLTVESVLEELSLPEPDEVDERWWWIDPEDDRAAWEDEEDEPEAEDWWESVPRVPCCSCGHDVPVRFVVDGLCRYCRCRSCAKAPSLGCTIHRRYDLPYELLTVLRHDVSDLLGRLAVYCPPCLVHRLCVVCGGGAKVAYDRCDTCRKYRTRTGNDRPEHLRKKTPPILRQLDVLLDPERLARAVQSKRRDDQFSAGHLHNLERLLDNPPDDGWLFG